MWQKSHVLKLLLADEGPSIGVFSLNLGEPKIISVQRCASRGQRRPRTQAGASRYVSYIP
jgi:hypothetical protein